MNNLKKVNQVLFYTLLIFSCIVLSDYSETTSRYYKDNNSISFDSELTNLYEGHIGSFVLDTINSNKNQVYYSYTFSRNTKYLEVDSNDIKEEYEIQVSDSSNLGCVIVSVNNQTVTAGNKYTFTFNEKATANEEINVKYYCNINIESDDNINQTVKVYNNINEEGKYLYGRGNVNITKEQYKKAINYKPDAGVDGPKLVVPTSYSKAELMNQIRLWLEKYIQEFKENNANNTNLSSIVDDRSPLTKDYDANEDDESIDGKYLNALERLVFKNLNFDSIISSSVPCMNIEEQDGNYTFVINSNFIGYAMTDATFESIKAFYFSNPKDSDANINKLFKEYMNKYYDPNSKDDAIKFIDLNGGIAEVIKGNKRINGINYFGGKLVFTDSFLKMGPTDLNDFMGEFDKAEALSNAIANRLIYTYPDLFNDSNAQARILNNTWYITNIVYGSWLDNSFHNYLVYYVDGRYILSDQYHSTDNKGIVFDSVLELKIDGTTSKTTIETIDNNGDIVSEEFNYSQINNLTYILNKNGKTEQQLVDEVKAYAKSLDAIFGTDYANSIDSELLIKSDESGIGEVIDDVITITFINTNPEYDDTDIGTVPTTTGPNIDSSLDTNDPSNGDSSSDSNESNDINGGSDENLTDSDTPTDNTESSGSDDTTDSETPNVDEDNPVNDNTNNNVSNLPNGSKEDEETSNELSEPDISSGNGDE